jgi:alpha-tubulin suppressor-like RCC1 family protein
MAGERGRGLMVPIQMGGRLARAALAGVATIAAVSLFAAPAQAAARSHLWVWGSGNLGIGTTGTRVQAQPVHGLAPFAVRQVVSFGPVAALLSNGTVWAWGTEGPLGNGGDVGSLTPVQVNSLSGITQLAATTTSPTSGTLTVYALRSDGTVWAWGTGTSGELGNGSFASSSTPVQVSGLTGVKSIAASGDTAYALRSDGTVWAWGAGASGQLGNGSTAASDVPVQVSLSSKATQLSASCDTAYALTGGGRIFAWGLNNFGQLGDGTTATSAAPALVRRVTGASSVVAGCVHAYAIVGGTVRAWGLGAQGENGDGHIATRLFPVTVTGLSNVISVSADHCTGYAVLGNGTAWAWGYGRQGNLGNGQDTNSSVPVQITGITSPVSSVTPWDPGGFFGAPTQAFGGVASIVARGTDGSLWSWGYIGFGANGSGGAGANPGRVPRVPAAAAVFPVGPWFAAV